MKEVRMNEGFPTNRRSIQRFPFRLPFTLSTVDESKKHSATSIDLHHLGVQITTQAQFSPGMRLFLRPASLDGTAKHTLASGEVKWQATGPQQLSRYGISFDHDIKWLLAIDKHSIPSIHEAYDEKTVSEFVLNSEACAL